MTSWFIALRIRPANRDLSLESESESESESDSDSDGSQPLEWLLAEWPTGAPAPINYWLSTPTGDETPLNQASSSTGLPRTGRVYVLSDLRREEANRMGTRRTRRQAEQQRPPTCVTVTRAQRPFRCLCRATLSSNVIGRIKSSEVLSSRSRSAVSFVRRATTQRANMQDAATT